MGSSARQGGIRLPIQTHLCQFRLFSFAICDTESEFGFNLVRWFADWSSAPRCNLLLIISRKYAKVSVWLILEDTARDRRVEVLEWLTDKLQEHGEWEGVVKAVH